MSELNNIDKGVVSQIPAPVINSHLRRGIRKALDGGRGRLRMDPQELGNAIGAAIDMEIERLRRVRERVARRKWIKDRLASSDQYVCGVGRSPKPTERGTKAFEAGMTTDN